MKKTLSTILILTFVFLSAQDNQAYFDKSDLNIDSKSNVKFINHIQKYLKLRNGENEFSTVKVELFGNPDLSGYDLSKLNKIIDTISENAKYNLKSPSTYLPNAIVLRRRENEWFSMVFFSGQNSYGAKKDISSMVTIDDEGNIKKDYEKN